MTRSQKSGIGAVMAAVMMVAFSASAEDKSAKKIGEAAVKKVEYIKELGLFDEQQIALGQLALKKSQNPEVRQLAQKLVQDHQQHLSNLKDWANARGLEVAWVMFDANQTGTGGGGMTQETQDKLQEKMDKSDEAIDKKKEKMREEMSKLEGKSGEEFDKAFVTQVKDNGKKGIDLVKEGQKEYRTDASFATFLNQTQPVIQSHVDAAKSVEKSLKG
ncbi:DUF4142 domain-containing protein [Myxococcaceae bacterium GXIMD 01537]